MVSGDEAFAHVREQDPAAHEAALRWTKRAYTVGVRAAIASTLVVLAFHLYGLQQERQVLASRTQARLARELHMRGAEAAPFPRAQLDSLQRLAENSSRGRSLMGVVRSRRGNVQGALRELIDEGDARYETAVQRLRVVQSVTSLAVLAGCGLVLLALARLGRTASEQFEVVRAQREELVRGNTDWRLRAEELQRTNEELEQAAESMQSQAIELEEHASDLHDANLRLEHASAAAEETAREQAALLNALPDVVLVLDRDGQYLKVVRPYNHPALPARTERLGRNLHDIVPRDAADTLVALIRSALDGGALRQAEVPMQLGGDTVWFDCAVVPLDRGRVMFVAHDMTVRKQQEISLREREERYRLLAKATNEVVFDVDLATRRVTWNDAIETSLRYRAADVDSSVGWWLTRVHPEDVEAVTATAGAAVMGDTQLWTQEIRLKRGDDSYASVLVRGYIQRDESGKAKRMIGSMLDLTARYAMERQLRQSQKMEAVGQLAGGVAHDFNNLLTVIISYASMTLASKGLDAEDREALEQINAAARRAADLTRQLLTFSRHRVYEARVVELNATVRDTEKLLRRLLPENIDFTTRLGPDVGTVKLDPQQLDQILMNLAVNAKDAMPDGGSFTIETQRLMLTEQMATQRAAIPAGPWTVLTVADTGSGMSADVQEHLFEPFFTTKAIGAGTGLGLSTVYGIVHQLGGYIVVYSEVGIGSTFKIYLPSAVEEAELPATPLPRVTRGVETVLVVDDDPMVRRVIVRTLEQGGYRVIEAKDGPSALAVLDAAGPPPQLMLSDLVMPGFGGRELVNEITARALPVRILLMSGYSRERVDQSEWSAEVAFVEKPFTPGALLTRVREVLDATAGATRSKSLA